MQALTIKLEQLRHITPAAAVIDQLTDDDSVDDSEDAEISDEEAY